MVKVCDAIMGSGKSQAAITYMNQHPEKRFIYITPYNDEDERIANACPGLHFQIPSEKIPEYHFLKIEHTRALLKEGKNIATTHAAFRFYTEDMIGDIEKYNYTLIIDEAVDFFQETTYKKGDVDVFLDGGFIEFVDGQYSYTGKEYTGSKMRELFKMLKCNNLIRVESGSRDGWDYYYWITPPDVLNAFSEVFVLTYLFDNSELRFFFDIYGIPYTKIGVTYEDKCYHFIDDSSKSRCKYNIREKIHVLMDYKYNEVGKNTFALSANWMKTHPHERDELKKKVSTFFNYNQRLKGKTSDDMIWSTYKKNRAHLTGSGMKNNFTEFNLKAENKYRDKTSLAYLVNIFLSPQKRNFFAKFGIEYDTDMYALSIMVQWIWRSGIREGKDIEIYIPSRRMRELLLHWMETLPEPKEAA